MRSIFQTAAAICCILGGTQTSVGEVVPVSKIPRVVFYADLIVRGTVSNGQEVTVTEVIAGVASVGQQLKVEQLRTLPRKKRENARDFIRVGDPRPNVEDEGAAILFLNRNGASWVLSQYGSGVKWIVGGKVYGHVLGHTTGSYDLLPDPDTPTSDDLRKAIDEAVTQKRRFYSAMALPDPAERVRALAEYVEPDRSREPTYDYARIEIGKTGAHGVPFLISQFERSEQRAHRGSLLHALGQSCDPAATGHLLKVVEQSAPVVLAIERFDWKTATEEERQAMIDWRSAISALEDQQTRRALPALRDALTWGAVHWKEVRVLENAARGLENLPDEDNIPVLAKALKTIPQDPFGWVAKERCIRALASHRYPAAVPALAEQLVDREATTPGFDRAEYNSRIAHSGLIKIVGRDLGKSKQPWLDWHAEQTR